MDTNVIDAVKSGSKDILPVIYKKYRNDFIRWAISNYEVTVEESKDIFQDIVIEFYQNVLANKLINLTCELKTYLFQLGKFKLINLKKREQYKHSYHQSIFADTPVSFDNFKEEENKAYINYRIKNYMNLLCSDCRMVIELFYLKELPLKEIAKIIGYKNESVAKKKRYECFKKLTEIYKKEKNAGIIK